MTGNRMMGKSAWYYQGPRDVYVNYAMWRFDENWNVLARERAGEQPVVSVQFSPWKKPPREAVPEPMKLKQRELEPA